MINLLKNKRIFLTAILFVVVGVIFFSNISPILAEPETSDTVRENREAIATTLNTGTDADLNKSDNDKGSGFWVWLVSWIVSPLISLEGVLISAVVHVLMILMSYNGFVDSKAVVLGWTQVRDVANLFFVLILLAISLGTILRVESYNFKKMLPKVLIMAVLVNFSRTISGLIIDFSQVVMLTFAASFAGPQGDGKVVALLRIKDFLTSTGITGGGLFGGNNTSGLTSTQVIASGILAVVMLLIALIVLLVMLVVIAMRIVMLWLLVVLSPLPFILSAFPQGQKYAQQWWQEFTKYIIVGPALAFFIWLAFAVAGSSGSTNTGEISVASMGDQAVATSLGESIPTNSQIGGINIPTPSAEPGGAAGTAQTLDSSGKLINGIATPDILVSFIIAIGMLMGGLMLTQQLGVAGGSFAGGMAGKIKQAGLAPLRGVQKLASAGIGEAGGLISRRAARLSQRGGAWRAAALFSPHTMREGFKTVREEAESQAFAESPARVADFISRYHPLIRRKTDYQRRAKRKDVRKYQGEIAESNYSEVELGNELKNENASKNRDANRVNALMREQTLHNQQDDYEVTVMHGEYGPEQNHTARMDTLVDNFGDHEAKEIAGDLNDVAEGAQKLRDMSLVSQSLDDHGHIVKRLNQRPDEAAAELTTRFGRGELERFLVSLEGKFVRRTVYGHDAGHEGEGRNMLDALTNTEHYSNMTNMDPFGTAQFQAVPKKMSDIITKRGQRSAERIKQVVGFNDVVDSSGESVTRLTSPAALIDAFRFNPEIAGAVLGNLKLDKPEFAFAHQLLTSSAAARAGVDPDAVDKVFHNKYNDNEMKDHITPVAHASISSSERDFLDRLNSGDLDFRQETMLPQHEADPTLHRYRPTILVNTTTGEEYGAVRPTIPFGGGTPSGGPAGGGTPSGGPAGGGTPSGGPAGGGTPRSTNAAPSNADIDRRIDEKMSERGHKIDQAKDELSDALDSIESEGGNSTSESINKLIRTLDGVSKELAGFDDSIRELKDSGLKAKIDKDPLVDAYKSEAKKIAASLSSKVGDKTKSTFDVAEEAVKGRRLISAIEKLNRTKEKEKKS